MLSCPGEVFKNKETVSSPKSSKEDKKEPNKHSIK